PLVLLELAAPAPSAVLRQQRGDVRVHGALARFTEERDRGADHALLPALVVEQADDVVAGVLQRAQRAGVDHTLRAADAVEQPLRVDDELYGVQITDASHDPSLPPGALRTKRRVTISVRGTPLLRPRRVRARRSRGTPASSRR